MKVLLATDGSPGAIDAAHAAVDLLRSDAELQIITVIPQLEDPMDTAGGFEGSLITEAEAEERHQSFAALGASALEATRRAAGRPVEVEVIESDEPGRRICELAAERSVDVLVIGGGERKWFSRLLHGSVMEYVVHHAPVPVLVVRHGRGD